MKAIKSMGKTLGMEIVKTDNKNTHKYAIICESWEQAKELEFDGKMHHDAWYIRDENNNKIFCAFFEKLSYARRSIKYHLEGVKETFREEYENGVITYASADDYKHDYLLTFKNGRKKKFKRLYNAREEAGDPNWDRTVKKGILKYN